MKKVKWVDKDVFFKLLSGESINPSINNLRGCFQSVYPIKLDGENNGSEGFPFIQSKVYPRATISRTGDADTTIYYIERHFFSKGSGLFALITYDSSIIQQRVEAAFRFLGDEGIGTDRNVGNGKFIPHFGATFNFPELSDAKYAINLGMYCPSDEEEFANLTADNAIGYELTKRGGWLSEPYNTWRKKSIYMFREGGCFHFGGNQSNVHVRGCMVDLRPASVKPDLQHPVWRVGMSLFVSCK